MNAKSSRRLRLERLEPRSLLSAIGLPHVSPAPLLAAAGEFSPIGGQDVVQAAMRVADQHAAATFQASPALTPEGRSPLSGDPPSQQPAAEARPGALAPAQDFRPTDGISLLADSTPGASRGLADVPSAVAMPDLSQAGRFLNLDAEKARGDEMAAGGAGVSPALGATTDAGIAVPGMEMTPDGLPPSRGIDTQNRPTTSAIHDLPPLRLSNDVAPDDPSFLYPSKSMLGTSDAQFVIDISMFGHGPPSFRGPLERAAETVVEDDISSSVDPSPSLSLPVKGPVSEAFAVSDTNSVGSLGVAAGTSLPALSSMANLPATNATFSDTTASRSLDDGFISLDDPSATTAQLGNPPSYNTGFNGVAGGGPESSHWLTGLLPDLPGTAGSNGSNAKTGPSGKNLAVEISSRPAAANLPPLAEAEEGGGIELAIAATAPAAAGDDLAPGGESAVAAEQLSEIRPESGAGLFCDIEVADAPLLPRGDLTAAATPAQNARPLPAAGIHHKADTTAEPAPQPAVASPLPMLLGASVLIFWGGLRPDAGSSCREGLIHSQPWKKRQVLPRGMTR